MRRSDVLDLLSTHLPEIRQRFGVRSLALFGSYARDEARPKSDVDCWSSSKARSPFSGTWT